MVVSELLRGEVVVHGPVHDRGEASVRQARDWNLRVLGEVAQRLTHLLGAGRAVEADDVDLHGLEGGQRRSDFGARQHTTGELNGDLDLERNPATNLGHGEATGVDGRLRPEEVEHRLDDEQVCPAFQDGPGLVDVAGSEIGVGDLAEGWELRSWSNRPGHESRLPRRRVRVSRSAGNVGSGAAELGRSVFEAVLSEHDGEGSEGVGLDDVAADLQERAVEAVDGVGLGGDEDLVAPSQVLATEVLGAEVHELEVRAGCTVEDEDAFAERGQIGRVVERESTGEEGGGSHGTLRLQASLDR